MSVAEAVARVSDLAQVWPLLAVEGPAHSDLRERGGHGHDAPRLLRNLQQPGSRGAAVSPPCDDEDGEEDGELGRGLSP